MFIHLSIFISILYTLYRSSVHLSSCRPDSDHVYKGANCETEEMSPKRERAI